MPPLARLLLPRHGESSGNVARDAAEAAGAARLDLDSRDMDVPLSRAGSGSSASSTG